MTGRDEIDAGSHLASWPEALRKDYARACVYVISAGADVFYVGSTTHGSRWRLRRHLRDRDSKLGPWVKHRTGRPLEVSFWSARDVASLLGVRETLTLRQAEDRLRAAWRPKLCAEGEGVRDVQPELVHVEPKPFDPLLVRFRK